MAMGAPRCQPCRYHIVPYAMPGNPKSDKGKAGKDKTENATPAWVAKRRLVKVGYSDANYVEVNSGLEEGDRVITLGRSAVRDGTAIQVLEAVQ